MYKDLAPCKWELRRLHILGDEKSGYMGNEKPGCVDNKKPGYRRK